MKFSIGVVLFNDFELLDVFGPVEFFGLLPDQFSISLVGEQEGYVRSAQGPRSVIDQTIDSDHSYNILLVPGGKGTRVEVNNRRLLDWIADQSRTADVVSSVCTGSALLAKSGIINDKRATTNKNAYNWVKSQSLNVQWIPQSRWVQDGKFFTSSGVSAGMDMALGIIESILGRGTSEKVADWAEYEWHSDSRWDPFAKKNNLI